VPQSRHDWNVDPICLRELGSNFPIQQVKQNNLRPVGFRSMVCPPSNCIGCNVAKQPCNFAFISSALRALVCRLRAFVRRRQKCTAPAIAGKIKSYAWPPNTTFICLSHWPQRRAPLLELVRPDHDAATSLLAAAARRDPLLNAEAGVWSASWRPRPDMQPVDVAGDGSPPAPPLAPEPLWLALSLRRGEQ
jgi:hypothetical protein